METGRKNKRVVLLMCRKRPGLIHLGSSKHARHNDLVRFAYVQNGTLTNGVRSSTVTRGFNLEVRGHFLDNLDFLSSLVFDGKLAAFKRNIWSLVNLVRGKKSERG